MTSQHFVHRRAVLLGALLFGTIATGCGGGESSGRVPTDCRKVSAGTDGISKVTVVGKNLAFDVTCIEVQPGLLEVTFDNQDSGVAHNFHITGVGVNGKTNLEPGLVTQVLSVKLTGPGSYTFACDPHATMEGKIHVVGKG